MTSPEHFGGSEADPLSKPTDLRGKRLPAQIGKRPARKSALGISKILKVLGPGLITGAADDDPSGIATYSSVGAQFGYGMLWTMPFVYPFMAGIQEISARLGRVSGRGIAGNMRRFYPRWLLYILVGLLVFANVINLGADIGAMGAAVNLLLGGPALLYCVLLATVSVVLQILIPYQKYAAALKWLTLSLFAYVATVFVVKIDWVQAVRGTFVPNISLNGQYLGALVAVLGTTVSPYLFFWQSAEEVEEMQSPPQEKALKRAPIRRRAISRGLRSIPISEWPSRILSPISSFSLSRLPSTPTARKISIQLLRPPKPFARLPESLLHFFSVSESSVRDCWRCQFSAGRPPTPSVKLCAGQWVWSARQRKPKHFMRSSRWQL